jgi:hypothetical protein
VDQLVDQAEPILAVAEVAELAALLELEAQAVQASS